MGIVSFFKEAGEKVFGWDTEEEVKGPTPEEIAAEKAAKREKAETALAGLVTAHELPIDNLSVSFDAGDVAISGSTEKSASAEKAGLVVGNVKGVASVDNQIEVTNPEPEAVYHTVEKGQYLSLIAKQHYGNAMKYNVIFEANKPMLKDPDLIYPGQVLRIPALEA